MNDVAQFAPTRAQRVIDDCIEAYKVCQMTAAYCINQGGEVADPHRMQVLLDCADVNLLMAEALGRASRFHRQIGRLVIEVSEACAEAYSDIEHGDVQLRKLYAVCVRAARSCAEFIGDIEPAPAMDAADEASKESFPASDPAQTPAR